MRTRRYRHSSQRANGENGDDDVEFMGGGFDVWPEEMEAEEENWGAVEDKIVP